MKKFVKPLMATLAVACSLPSLSNATVYTIGADPSWDPIANPLASPVSGEVVATGSNFMMYTASGAALDPGGARYSIDDLTGTFDDSLICHDESCTDYAMTLSSPSAFQSATFSFHDIRVFDEGVYTFETCLSDGSVNCSSPSPATLTVGAGQLGAHMLWNWGPNTNIDLLMLWDANTSFTRPEQLGGLVPSDTRLYTLASQDGDGDGIDGFRMMDGPFASYSVNINLYMDPPLAVVPVPAAIWLFASGLLGLVGFSRR